MTNHVENWLGGGAIVGAAVGAAQPDSWVLSWLAFLSGLTAVFVSFVNRLAVKRDSEQTIEQLREDLKYERERLRRMEEENERGSEKASQ